MSVIRSLAALCLTAAAISVSAETLTDPTRPPAELNPVMASSQIASAGPTLQSVLVSRGRRIAIISGKEVRVNDKFGEAKVVKITDMEVVLRSGKNVQTLKLFPDVDKQKVQRASYKDAGKRGRKRQGKE
jgi:MSHA biogenesis protein MshK